jgi:hypothetical protein
MLGTNSPVAAVAVFGAAIYRNNNSHVITVAFVVWKGKIYLAEPMAVSNSGIPLMPAVGQRMRRLYKNLAEQDR